MKEKIKLVIVFIIGILISVVISVYAATVIGAGEVSFNGTTSNIKYNGTTAANVSDAINGVYDNANTLATNVTNLTTRVSALESYTSGKVTCNTTYIDVCELYYYKYLKFVIVGGYFHTKTSIPNTNTFNTSI